MHLLYADESGSISDPSQRFFVLAGVAVFERSTHWVEVELNQIAARFNPAEPHEVELHGSPMRTGSHGWSDHGQALRKQAIVDALSLGVAKHHPRDLRLFAAVLEKNNFAGQDIAQIAFEQLSSRFDQYLGRLYREKGDKQRGLILFDKSSTERRIQTLARDFKHTGHSFGITRNYAEVPVFLDSRASRLIQLADLVAYAIFRHHEHGDSTYYNACSHCFDAEGGVVHGLYVR
ncbi:DUF3800 domain-containing protein [Granulicella tundricola]|uniref:DUF3800 domain-containing protein n=1 Tax=Granulicella tundricola (strain ATCC BAA-1859 / DSM 23138 / MP5ACTX9) TaxID=1198114 RepID=E8X3G9_GRATM|nr:DUF3800 domain-containing protein [Granulicella tundricola]ADW68160.1 hypothetical protein AciX9_1097 [Granulicella tundricola MP5ACTX9]